MIPTSLSNRKGAKLSSRRTVTSARKPRLPSLPNFHRQEKNPPRYDITLGPLLDTKINNKVEIKRSPSKLSSNMERQEIKHPK